MRFPKQDIVATVLEAVAGLLYLLWAVGFAPPGLDSGRMTGLVVPGLGFAASASAVVPNLDQLIHGSKAYLAVTSLIGVVALIAGVQVLLTATDVALGVLMAAMGTLWLIATIHLPVPSAGAQPVTSERRRAAGVS